ncbi:MAG: sigma-70 family RNA polymerase sigma factor [Candidatus Peribacteria bacterium]|jgi:RNA polymerase sigma-70 factor (ECF subfamily)|nr:sigma-70 family RNA polymerase sigma factor [Candidatus Peribacteria bacterium]
MVIDFELQFKQLLIQQDELTFNEFYLQTVDIFYRYLKSNYFISEEDSNDIIADFYVKCWNGLPKYDINQNFSGYIWSIFKNNLKDFFKKRGELSFSSINSDYEESFEEYLENPENFTEILETNYTFEQIQQSMFLLDEMSQEILFLKYIEEKSYTEIAKILNISQDTARQRCSRGLKQLKSQIENNAH